MPKRAKRKGSGLARFAPVFSALLLVLTLGGCATGPAPVAEIGERSKTGSSWPGAVHVVAKGDTLYSICWRYGLDYQDVAKANGIGPPYTIFVGQRIMLSGVAPKARTAGKPRKRQEQRVAKTTAPPKRKVAQSSQASSIKWRWPHDGQILKRFSLQGSVNKGVDIAGRLGDSVTCAADGIVVYAGSGLGGYGKLVIVKHNAQFLSAYGHNSNLLVREGDSVKGGQIVAEIGSSGKDLAMLHFEIRKDGKPKDPLLFLPRR